MIHAFKRDNLMNSLSKRTVRDRVIFDFFFRFMCAANSHTPVSYESTGTTIFEKFDQIVGQKGSLRILIVYSIYYIPFDQLFDRFF